MRAGSGCWDTAWRNRARRNATQQTQRGANERHANKNENGTAVCQQYTNESKPWSVNVYKKVLCYPSRSY